jgi:hypothetical protein
MDLLTREQILELCEVLEREGILDDLESTGVCWALARRYAHAQDCDRDVWLCLCRLCRYLEQLGVVPCGSCAGLLGAPGKGALPPGFAPHVPPLTFYPRQPQPPKFDPRRPVPGRLVPQTPGFEPGIPATQIPVAPKIPGFEPSITPSQIPIAPTPAGFEPTGDSSKIPTGPGADQIPAAPSPAGFDPTTLLQSDQLPVEPSADQIPAVPRSDQIPAAPRSDQLPTIRPPATKPPERMPLTGPRLPEPQTTPEKKGSIVIFPKTPSFDQHKGGSYFTGVRSGTYAYPSSIQVDSQGRIVTITGGPPAAGITWAAVLANGPQSGGTSPIISAGDAIIGAADLTIRTGGFNTNYINVTGNWEFPSDVLLTDPNARLDVGDGTGSAQLNVNKSDAGIGSVQFNVAGTTRASFDLNAVEDLEFNTYNAVGALVSTTTVDNATGNWTFPADVDITGNITLSSASPSFALGNFTGSPTLYLDKAEAGTAILGFRNVNATDDRFLIVYDATENLDIERYVANVLQDTTTIDGATGGWTMPATLAIDGADIADVPAKAPNLAVGALADAVSGITIFTTATGLGCLAFSDAAGTGRQHISGNHSPERLEFFIAGATRYYMTGSALQPALHDGYDFGLVGTRWKDGYFQGSLTIGTNTTWDSASPVLTAGDFSGSPVVNIDKSEGGTAALRFRNVNATDDRFQIVYDATENLDIERYVANVLQDTTTIDGATHLWTYPGSATYDSAAPIVQVGDGTGAAQVYVPGTTPNITIGSNTSTTAILLLNRAAAGNNAIEFYDTAVPRWRVVHEGTNENFWLERYSAVGVFQDRTTVSSAAHLWTYPGSATYDSAAPNITVGDGTGNAQVTVSGTNARMLVGSGTGSPFIRLNKVDAGTTDIQWQNGGLNAWILRNDAAEDLDFRRFNALGVYQDSTTIAFATHLWTYPGSAIYDSASPLLVLGNQTGAPSIRFQQSADGAGQFQIWNGAAQISVLFFGVNAPVIAPANGCYYFRMDNDVDALYKRVGGAWTLVAGAARVFFNTQQNSQVGYHAGVIATAGGGNAYVEFMAPDDFQTIISADLILLPTGSNSTSDLDIYSQYAAVGQVYNTHAQSDVASTYALVANTIYALSLTNILTSLAAGDFVGIRLLNNTAGTNVLVIGVELNYIRG